MPEVHESEITFHGAYGCFHVRFPHARNDVFFSTHAKKLNTPTHPTPNQGVPAVVAKHTFTLALDKSVRIVMWLIKLLLIIFCGTFNKWLCLLWGSRVCGSNYGPAATQEIYI